MESHPVISSVPRFRAGLHFCLLSDAPDTARLLRLARGRRHPEPGGSFEACRVPGAPRRYLLAFAFQAVSDAVRFAEDLRAVPNQKAGVAGEFVLRMGDNLHDQFLGDKFPSRDDGVHGVGFIQFTDDAACIRGVCGLECHGELSCASLTSERTRRSRLPLRSFSFCRSYLTGMETGPAPGASGKFAGAAPNRR
jgi:hypothetical protein